jgi:hypothetical protein
MEPADVPADEKALRSRRNDENNPSDIQVDHKDLEKIPATNGRAE